MISVLWRAVWKFGIGPDVLEVVEADPISRQGATDGIGEAEVDRPAERHPYDHRDVNDGRRDKDDGENPAALEEPAPRTARTLLSRRSDVHLTAAILVHWA